MKKVLIPIIFIYVFSFNIKAQITLEKSDSIVTKYISNMNIPTEYLLYSFGYIDKNSIIKQIQEGSYITSPSYQSYFYFVDNDPLKNWEHECSYIFVNKATGSIEHTVAKIPPVNLHLARKLKFFNKEISSMKFLKFYPKPMGHKSMYNNKNYAVIISGGADLANNWIRYWNDCQAMYKLLVYTYGYLPENIYCLVSDGTNPANDRALYNGQYDSSPLDFNGDGIDDIKYDATKKSLKKVFNILSNKLSIENNLVVFSTDHGGKTNNDVVLYLWGESITATEFANLIEPIKAGHISFIMEQCYSGGFVSKLCKNERTISTASAYNEVSYAKSPSYAYNEFVYHWISAMGNKTPEGTIVHADFNQDGNISFREAFLYAKNNDMADETPQYCYMSKLSEDKLGLFHTPITADLMIRDDVSDTGVEPNPNSINWRSPDIWLTDINFTPITPPYLRNELTGTVYVGVRIKNIDTVPSAPNNKIHLFWAKSSLGSQWKVSWVGNSPLSSIFRIPTGGRITPPEGFNINSLKPNEERTIYIPWNIPKNEQFLSLIESSYKTNSLLPKNNDAILEWGLKHFRCDWGFALMAKIDDGNDIKDNDKWQIQTSVFAKNSNNVAVDDGNLFYIADRFEKQILIEPSDVLHKDIVFRQNKADNISINDYAECVIRFSSALAEKFDYDNSTGIKLLDENTVLLTGNESKLSFYQLNKKDEAYFISIKVNFLSDKLPEVNNFDLDLILLDDGATTDIKRLTAIRDPNIYFKAQAEADKVKVVKAKEEITLTSNQIIDDAHYLWYDDNKKPIGEGASITLTPQKSNKYTVMIEKMYDGYKSYDNVEVLVVDGKIESISPNPAYDNINIIYSLSDNAIDVSIRICNTTNNITQSYPINNSNNQANISVDGFPSGSYIVQLCIKGVVVDSKTVIVK